MSESELQTQVIATARQLGYRIAHFRPARTDKGWRTPVQADGRGFPDLVMIRGDRLIVAELKAQRGVIHQAQLDWLDAFRRTGIPAYLWRPADWQSGDIARCLL